MSTVRVEPSPARLETLLLVNAQWGDVMKEYRQWLVASGKPVATTVRQMMWQIRRLAEAHPTTYRLTTANLAAWLGSHEWAPATIKSNRATLRSFYGWAYRAGHVRVDPSLDLAPVRLGHREPVPTPEWVVAQAKPRDDDVALMIQLAARQGLRRAEVAQVHTRDVRRAPDGWALVVRGKGSKDRTIPLHPDIASRILARPHGWVFPSPNVRGPGHLTPSRVGFLISEALPRGYAAHSLRRRFATLAADGSHDLRAVQRLLGHASIVTTQRYVSSSDARMREALKYAA